MSNETTVSELGRSTLTGTRKNKSYALELVLHEPAYDEEVQAWRCDAFIYGLDDQIYKLVGYGADTLQALSMDFHRIYRKFIEFIECGIHIEIDDLHDAVAIDLFSTAGHPGEMNMPCIADISESPIWIAESNFRLNADAPLLTIQIGKPLILNDSWFCAARIAEFGEAKYYAARDAVIAIAAAMRGTDCVMSGLGVATIFSDGPEVYSFEQFRSFYFRPPETILPKRSS